MRPPTSSERRTLDALLAVDRSAPLAEVTSRVPVEATVADEGAGLLLFVDDGRLSLLEYWTTEDDTPAEFPHPDRIHVSG